jgi:hypothetical protein
MMKADIGGTKPAAANFAFSAFLFSVFAWALIETQLFNGAAGFRAHLLASAFGLGVSAIALRRCRLWWSLFADTDTAVNRATPNRYHIGDVASCVALVAAGCVLALSGKVGSLALFAICAGAFSLAPWSRFVFCRRHFFVSCSMLGAGAASILMVERATVGPFIYPLWALFLWMIAVSELLITWIPDRPAISRPGPIRAAELQNSEQAADPQLEKP